MQTFPQHHTKQKTTFQRIKKHYKSPKSKNNNPKLEEGQGGGSISYFLLLMLTEGHGGISPISFSF
jgi:hypothetical protein